MKIIIHKNQSLYYFRILLLVFLFQFPIISQAQLKHLQNVNDMPPHPRILMFAGEEEQIKANIAADSAWNKIHQFIMNKCDSILLIPELKRVMEGRRLLLISQEALQRIFYLSYAYRMSGQDKYVLKAEKEMLSIATFSDWNPSHFLDVSEMTMAMAIGYDWLYGKLSPDSREIIKSAILRKGIDPSLNQNFALRTNNWGQVCNSGMTYGALALFEDVPELSKMVIDRAIETIRFPMGQYDPDGAYPEGPGYWNYGTSFNVLFLSAIEKVFNTDYGLSELPGFMKTAYYLANVVGPAGIWFNYQDGIAPHGLKPAMFWFASKSGNTSILWQELGNMDKSYFFGAERILPASLLWGSHFRMSAVQPPAYEESIWVGQGITPVALMRTSWIESDAIFVGFKGGRGNASHGHLDVGSFVMEADGVRWASDLGGLLYNLLESKGVNIWDWRQNGQRWEVFSYNNFSHNTLTVDQQLHRVDGYANIRSYSASPDFINAISDISAIFDDQLAECVRGIAIVDKQYVVVRDELKTLDKETTVSWRMLTYNEAKITGKNTIELKKDGKKLKLEVAEPAKVTMKTWRTDPANDWDLPNPGTILVGFEVTIPAGASTALTVKLIPQSAKKTSAKIPALKDWPNYLFDPQYIKSTMEKVTWWQLANPKHEPRDWTNGAFYAGVFAAWETTQSKDIYKAMMDMGEAVKWTPFKRWYHADDIAICQTYIDLYRSEKHPDMIQPTIDTLDKFMANPYPVRGIEVIKWWWCDALFMAPPAMIKMGVTIKNNEYLSKSDEYFRECYDLLYNKDEHLFARDLNYVIKNDGKDRYEANGKRIFWSRGNGWVMGGLVRILKELPKNYPQRPFYEQLFKEMALKIVSLQQSDGLWRASLLDPDSYPGGEVSGTGFFCYALAWGINNGLLDIKTCWPAVEKAWIALNGCVNEEGHVGWVQPIGADPRKNFNADSWEVYGTGAFLLAGSEVIKMKKDQ